MSVTEHQSPLDLPELRFRIGQFLESTDAVSCSQVCRAWGIDFTRVIWRTIELKGHPGFVELDQAIVLKHGHHIRSLTSSLNQQELAALNLSNIQHLRKANLHLPAPQGLLPHTADVIRRSGVTLNRLEISGGGAQLSRRTDILVEAAAIPWTAPYNTVLTTLILHCLRMTRTLFSAVLSGCPRLDDLRLMGCAFTGSDSPIPFQHERIKYLNLSVDSAMSPDAVGTSLSLLVHFPKLVWWSPASVNSTIDDSTASALKRLMQEHCPKLVTLSTSRIQPALIHSLLTKVFDGLQEVVFEYNRITPSIIHSLLYHRATLTAIGTHISKSKDRVYVTDQVSPMSDEFQKGWMVQLLPSNCHRLRKFTFPFHDMDMDSVEAFPWKCLKLRDLRIRVKGLDTRESILEVIDRWRQARRNPQEERAQTGDPKAIENRVVRHLLQFPELSTVWLGCKLWTA